MAKILVIQFRNDDASKEREQKRFNVCFALGELEYVNACSAEFAWDNPQKLLQSKGAVILGGSADFYLSRHGQNKEMDEALMRVEKLINYLFQEDFPTLGVCFGHQTIAHFLGVKIEHHDNLPEAGAVEVKLMPAGRKSLLFADLPENFLVQMTHKDYVSEVPQNCTLLGSTAKCPIAAIGYKTNIFGVQFHPELDWEENKKFVTEINQTYNSPDTHFADSPLAPKILKNFLLIANKCNRF